MRKIKTLELIDFPESPEYENFRFECAAQSGIFSFEFKFFCGQWNCWYTLPNGQIRQAGVYPNSISGTGASDFAVVFKTDLSAIGRTSLFFTQMYLITWD